MAILRRETRALADAVPDPKRIWHNIDHYIVFTGADILLIDTPPSQEEQDANAARTYAKLAALRQMTPAQVQAWVAANVTNLAQAQDAIATLAIAVSILSRRL